MDHLREGIGLRGYGQKDPKIEYKKEGYEMFRVMMDRIAANVANKLYRVRLERQQQPAAAQQQAEAEVPEFKHKERRMVMSHAGASAAAEGGDDVHSPVRRDARERAALDLDQDDRAVGHRHRSLGEAQPRGDLAERGRDPGHAGGQERVAAGPRRS